MSNLRENIYHTVKNVAKIDPVDTTIICPKDH